jgi:anti-anti-sigma factor
MPPIDYNPETGTHCIRFEGNLTSDRCRKMEGEMVKEIEDLLFENPQARLAFDLGGVDFVVSAFIRICLMTARRLPKGNFTIVRCRPEVRKIFSVAGLDKLIELS